MSESLFIGAYGTTGIGMLDSKASVLSKIDATSIDLNYSTLRAISQTREALIDEAVKNSVPESPPPNDFSFYSGETETQENDPYVAGETTTDKIKKYAPFALGEIAVAGALALLLKK